MRKDIIELKEKLQKRYQDIIDNYKQTAEKSFNRELGDLSLVMLLSSYDFEFREICNQLGQIQELEIQERRMEEMFPGIVKLSDETGYNIHICYRLFMAAGNDAIRIIKEAKDRGYHDNFIFEASDLYFQFTEYMDIKLHGPTDFKKLSDELCKIGKEKKLPKKLRNGWN